MGTILERPDGRVVIQWTDASGRKRQRTLAKRRADGRQLSVTARRKEAQRRLGELEDQAERQRLGLAPRPLKDERLSFGALHEHWEATRGASCRSQHFAGFIRPHILELFPLPAVEVTTAAVDRLLTARAKHLSAKSVNHIRGHLHSVFEAARVQGGPWEGRPNPIAGARRFKVGEKAVALVTPDEWPRLAPAIYERWRPHAAVAFFTGLRRGDVFSLAKADVDLFRGIITARISKAQKVRVLPIHEALRPYLEEALATPGPQLLPWPHGKRLPNLVKILRRACGRAGLVTGYEIRCRRRASCGWSEVHAADDVPAVCPRCGRDSVYARPIPRKITFHGLRHSFGTAVVAAGGTAAGQALLAHSDPRMTQRYTHLADGLLSSVVTRAFAAVGAAPGLRSSTVRAKDGIIVQQYQLVTKVGPPGLEPGLRCQRTRILSPPRLPFRHGPGTRGHSASSAPPRAGRSAAEEMKEAPAHQRHPGEGEGGGEERARALLRALLGRGGPGHGRRELYRLGRRLDDQVGRAARGDACEHAGSVLPHPASDSRRSGG